MTDQESQQDGDEPEPAAQPVYPQKGPGREDMVHSYLPNEDDWTAKTILDLNDPAAIAALQQFDTMFPEVDDLQPMIDTFIDEFLKGRTSVGGEARNEYQRIFESMFGGHPDEDDQAWKGIATALGADVDED